MGRPLIQLDGREFGRLVVLGLDRVDKVGALWKCKCACGSVKSVYGHLLRRGQVKSCSCLRDEKGAAKLEDYRRSGKPHPRFKHGDGGTQPAPEWVCWVSIKGRCLNPKDPAYPDYGGRGICICERWLSSYEDFLVDVGRKPSPQHTLDRIEVNGNYEPGNVRWATRLEQARNRRNSLYIEHDGQRLCLAEWAEKTGIKNWTIRARLRSGWSVGRALTDSVKERAA